MDFSTTRTLPTYRSQTFRTPFAFERSLGLWVDRMGEGQITGLPAERLRILGLHALILVVEGKGSFTTESCGTQSVSAGDLMLLFPEEAHSYQARDNWFLQWINYSGSEADLLAETGILSPSHPVIKNCRIPFQTAFTRIAEIMAKEDLSAALERKALLLHCLHAAHRAIREEGLESHGTGRLQKAIRIVGQRFADPALTIPELASQCGLSETHFRRLFKEMTGRTPLQYLTALKISAAKKHLSEGMSIKETATAVGIKDEFYFMRFFKKNAGIPAGAFAKSAR